MANARLLGANDALRVAHGRLAEASKRKYNLDRRSQVLLKNL